jgi:hypothetical protein
LERLVIEVQLGRQALQALRVNPVAQEPLAQQDNQGNQDSMVNQALWGIEDLLVRLESQVYLDHLDHQDL